MDSFTPREIERMYLTFHHGNETLECSPSQVGWEDNQAGIFRCGPRGGEHKIAQSMPDVDDYLGYALLFTNVTSYLHVVLKMPWNKDLGKVSWYYATTGRPKSITVPTMKEIFPFLGADVNSWNLTEPETERFRRETWSLNKRGRKLHLIKKFAFGGGQIAAIESPNFLEAVKSTAFIDLATTLFKLMICRYDFPATRSTLELAKTYIACNIGGNTPGWYNQRTSFTVTSAAQRDKSQKSYTVECHTPRGLQTLNINPHTFTGAIPPAQGPELPPGVTLKDDYWRDLLKNKDDEDIIYGATVIDHHLILEWIKQIVAAVYPYLGDRTAIRGVIGRIKFKMGTDRGTIIGGSDVPFTFQTQKSKSKSLHFCINTHFPHGGVFDVIPTATENGKVYWCFRTGISLPQVLAPLQGMWHRFATKIFIDTGSVWASLTGAAVFADNAISIGVDHVQDEQPGFCLHPEKSKHDPCDRCKSITRCNKLSRCGNDLVCGNCRSALNVGENFKNSEAIKLAKVYPEVAQALKSAKARSRGTNAFSDSLDATAIAVMTDLKKDPTDNKIIRGDAIVPNFPLVPGAQNPFFRPAMHYDHLVIPTMDDKLGNYVSSNMGVTSAGMAGLRWVHDSTIQKQVVRATANLHNNGQQSVSCLQSLDQPDTPLAALTTAAGKEMRQAWSAIKKLTVFDRKVPYHLDKRYDTEITSPGVAQALNTNMEAVGSRGEHDTSAVDQILLSNYAGRIPVIKHVELENDRQRIIRLTEQFEEMYRFRLPRGVDGTPCPSLDNDMASWTILKLKQFSVKKLKRFQGTCDCQKVADPAASWITVALKVIREAIKNHGPCSKMGVPMTMEKRVAHGLGLGHTDHGNQMTVGWVQPTPDHIDDYDDVLGNIDVETRGYNKMGLTFPEQYCFDWIAQVAHCHLGKADLCVDPYKKDNIPVPTRAFKKNPKWHALVAAKLKVPVESLDSLSTLKSLVQVHPIEKTTQRFVSPRNAISGPGPLTSLHRKNASKGQEE